MPRIALGLQYDGSAFCGWQTQASACAVQDALQRALRNFLHEEVQIVCAGRTDAGVHATYQVVHFDTQRVRPLAAWVRGVNAQLPATIAVRWARVVPPDFHARYSARARRYDYWILNDPVRAPLLVGRVGWVFRPLDVTAMQQAAALLVGTHDFSAFRSAECQAATPVRELRLLTVQRYGTLIRVRAVANAFLHHMVRNIVGTLVYVGLGRQPPQWAGEVLARRNRALAAPTFSADGLYLTHVEYHPAFDLPAPQDVPPLLT
ncbi:MAG: tRNA pseudouridine(38-40) synthase TruA [Sutterellaceae bacterium]|nr:tRNA pseudouridine(38-40) synthase TruA [Burkholderiaceae bacterium]MCX7901168.1 tRNA pseudouridine(38-40) synthase TruA [Burkholderiaceae bacterium]MDW8430714.1 tRNA pseudouridine(38-40) synthase TruA [Sutterellaceae bacterium]